MGELKLSKSVDINGKKVDKIDYDLDAVTGADIEKACKSIMTSGYVILAQETDPVLHAHIFAVAADMDYNDIKMLGAKDFLKATSLVRDFFYLG